MREFELCLRPIMVSNNPTVSVAYLQGLIAYFEECGEDPAHLLGLFSVEQASLSDPNQRLPVSLFEAMLDHGEQLLEDPNIGLHVGERIKPGQFGVLGYSVMNCATLEESIQRHMRYENLVSTVAHTRYLTDQDPVRLIWDTGSRQASRHFAEDIVASWVTFTRWILGRDLAPLKIAFRHDRPDDLTEHERLFRCPLSFNAEQVEVQFPQPYLNLRLPHPDPCVVAMMDAYAEELLMHVRKEPGIVAQAEAFLTEGLMGSDVSLDHLAGHLGLSRRQLQRELRQAGVTYQSLLDQTRRTLALRYILDRNMSFIDVAFMTGFSDASAFQRAFRRWTGMSPGQYRQCHGLA